MIEVSVNNKLEELNQDIILNDFLQIWEQLQDDSTPYAIALNEEFVPRSQYEHVTLKDGDSLDIVRPVGGG